jgi:hypothetical protein
VVLDRLHQYLRDYAELMPATVAVERYQQSSGSIERGLLESEFGIPERQRGYAQQHSRLDCPVR